MKNQKGFLPIIIILVVLLGIGGVYFFIKSKPQTIVESPNPTPVVSLTPTTDPTANWKEYSNSKLGIFFKYPNNYQLIEENTNKISFGFKRTAQEEVLPYLTIYTQYQIDDPLRNCIVTPNIYPCFDDTVNNGNYEVKVGNKVGTGLDIKKGSVDSDFKIVKLIDPKIEIEMYVSGGGLARTFEQILSTFKFTN